MLKSDKKGSIKNRIYATTPDLTVILFHNDSRTEEGKLPKYVRICDTYFFIRFEHQVDVFYT